MIRKHKKLLLVIITFMILGISSISFIYFNTRTKNSSVDKNKVAEVKKDNTKKKTKKESKKNKTDEEKLEENANAVENTNNVENQSSSVSGSNSSQSNNVGTTNNQTTSTNNTKNNQNTNTTVQNQQQSQSTPKSAWDQLGISEYEYYNAKRFSWEEVAYKNMADCQREAQAINQKYSFVTNYGNVAGKYVDTVGCWVEIYVNGTPYYLSQFRAMGY